MNAARRHLLFFFLLLVPALGFGVDQTASTAQVALLDMDTSGKSGAQHLELVALKRIFATLGIPADVVSGPERLSDYRVVCTAGALLNTTLAREISNGLFDYVVANSNLSLPLSPTAREAGVHRVAFDRRQVTSNGSRTKYVLGDLASPTFTTHHDPDKLARLLMKRVWSKS